MVNMNNTVLDATMGGKSLLDAMVGRRPIGACFDEDDVDVVDSSIWREEIIGNRNRLVKLHPSCGPLP